MFKFFKKKLLIKLLGNIKYAESLGVKIGKGCRIYITSWGTEPEMVEIGDNVTITSEVVLLTHDGSTCLVKNEAGERYYNYANIKIGNNVFIGYRSIILPGVTIGNDVVIAAGSIVTKSIEDGCLVGGNPAKVIKSFKDYSDKVREVHSTVKYKK